MAIESISCLPHKVVPINRLAVGNPIEDVERPDNISNFKADLPHTDGTGALHAYPVHLTLLPELPVPLSEAVDLPSFKVVRQIRDERSYYENGAWYEPYDMSVSSQSVSIYNKGKKAEQLRLRSIQRREVEGNNPVYDIYVEGPTKFGEKNPEGWRENEYKITADTEISPNGKSEVLVVFRKREVKQ